MGSPNVDAFVEMGTDRAVQVPCVSKRTPNTLVETVTVRTFLIKQKVTSSVKQVVKCSLLTGEIFAQGSIPGLGSSTFLIQTSHPLAIVHCHTSRINILKCNLISRIMQSASIDW